MHYTIAKNSKGYDLVFNRIEEKSSETPRYLGKNYQTNVMSVPQRSVMFNKENPFEGSDGFTHLLYRPALVSQLQHNSHKYRYFSNQTKNLFTKNILDTNSSDEDAVRNKDPGEMGDKKQAKESLNQMANVPEEGV